jgi:hypothetical protein
MLPLSDGLHPRRFPIANVALIAANFAVWGSSTSYRTSSRSSTTPVWRAPSTTPAMGPSRGRSAGSRLCLCTAAEATSSATCSSSPSSARTSRTLTDASIPGLLRRRRVRLTMTQTAVAAHRRSLAALARRRPRVPELRRQPRHRADSRVSPRHALGCRRGSAIRRTGGYPRGPTQLSGCEL